MPTEDPDPLVMSPMLLGDLAAEVRPVGLLQDHGVSVTGIEYDSRKIKPGDLFVALTGGYFDGHQFASQALERGAVALLVERQLDIPVPQIVVQNSRKSLAKVASAFYQHPSNELNVIGITGTDGKTTTAFLLESILQAAGVLTGVIGTIGVRVGDKVLDADTRQTTPESLDVQRHLRTMISLGARAAVIEATSHGLDLFRLDDVAFRIGAVTNVTHEHLEYHKTIDAYRRAKGILFERVGENGGTVIVNSDDEGARSLERYAHGAKTVRYSAGGFSADIVARKIQLGVTGSRFAVQVEGSGEMEIETPLVGSFNVANTLCAIGAALECDISLEICQHALRHTPQIPGRMEPVDCGQPFSVIVDYAHSPESVEKVLSLLRGLTPGKIILVMGSAGERDRTKRPLQGAIAAQLADFSVFTSEDPRFEDPDAIIDEIASGALASGAIEGKRFSRVTDRRAAIEQAMSHAEPGDCVLLAGKGHERSIIWGLEKRPWDESAVAREILGERGYQEGR